jgi:hypothetical protein
MYAAAADAVNTAFPNAVHVLCHLLGMSIELSLKAFLRHHGYTLAKLKRLGHRLGELYDEARKLGLYDTGSRSFRIRVLGVNFDQRIFAYPAEGNLVIILPLRLREVAHDLLIEVFPLIHPDVNTKHYSRLPGLTIKSEYPEDVNPVSWAVS